MEKRQPFQRTRLQFFGVTQVNALLSRAFGIVYATRSAPPVLCIHGTVDTQVPYAQSVQLTEYLRGLGVRR